MAMKDRDRNSISFGSFLEGTPSCIVAWQEGLGSRHVTIVEVVSDCTVALRIETIVSSV